MSERSFDYPAELEIDYPDRDLVWLPTMFLLLVRGNYPRWWFDWNVELIRFSTRVWSYLALLRDEYPSTDEEQSVHITISYPNTRELKPRIAIN
jgi:hypothetical protein